MVRGVEDGFEMIQVLYIYYVLYFYHYGDSSTSDQQASDPGGWGPLLQVGDPWAIVSSTVL